MEERERSFQSPLSKVFSYTIAALSVWFGIVYVLGFILVQTPTYRYFGFIPYDTSLYFVKGGIFFTLLLAMIIVTFTISLKELNKMPLGITKGLALAGIKVMLLSWVVSYIVSNLFQIYEKETVPGT